MSLSMLRSGQHQLFSAFFKILKTGGVNVVEKCI